MALVTITGSNSYSAAKYGLMLPVEAGEALVAGYACVIKDSSGVAKAYHAGTAVSGGTGTNAVKFDGFAVADRASGEAVTLVGQGNIVMLDGNAGLTIGTDLYLSATAGVLSDAKIAGTDLPVARVISTSAIRVLR